MCVCSRIYLLDLVSPIYLLDVCSPFILQCSTSALKNPLARNKPGLAHMTFFTDDGDKAYLLTIDSFTTCILFALADACIIYKTTQSQLHRRCINSI